MKQPRFVSRQNAGVTALLLAVVIQLCIEAVQAQFYRPPQTLPNFTFYMRRAWTNQAGHVFGAGAPVRLSDFAGTVVFLKFFDPT